MNDVGTGSVPLVEVWRGDRLENLHRGHAVIASASGDIVQAWGDPDALYYPRSSFKMIQALPLVESGAAEGLSEDRLALACASHQGSAMHVAAVSRWLADLGLSEADLRCGAHEPYDIAERNRLICSGGETCQLHNNCSGKHSGFLTLNRHLGGDPEYLAIDHPVQRAVKAAFEEVTGEDNAGWGIDGCSAPSFATSVGAMARAMARFAGATGTDARARAMIRIRDAMRRHPEMVAGEPTACTELMRAMQNRVVLKSGADGAYVAILPERKLGVAVKIADGSQMAREVVIASILVTLGVLDPAHPEARRRLGGPQVNCGGKTWGDIRTAPGFP